ncbi:carboxymuconolactone decarboxylase family protein [Marinomonas epiphytica]
MTTRANYFLLAPQAMTILMEQESYFKTAFAEDQVVSLKTWELVKLRVSQINQCAFCIDMHQAEALSAGERAERVIGLSAWQDMPYYSQTERLALKWAEILTLNQTIEEDTYQQLDKQLGSATLVNLTLAVNAINSWNRVARVFKPEVGSYKAAQ